MANPNSEKRIKNEEDLLVERFLKGERSAFDELYRRYKDRILNYINRMISDKGTAEELTQEVFINVYTNISNYKPKGFFKAWIYTIASNLAKNELKKRSYKINVSLFRPIRGKEADITLEDVLTNEELSSEFIIKNNELKEEIEVILRSLPVPYREVIVLCAMEGLSYEEAARILKINVKTVSSRLARARQSFIKRIKAERKK